MESEEFEQIPWASLVAEHDDGIDKRIYLAVGLVGVLVIAVFGMRFLGNGSQPVPPHDVALGSSTSVAVVEPTTAPPTSMVIAEADLRAEEPPEDMPADRLIEVTAEWFVTDWFTRDGSQETIRSVKAVLSPTLVVDALPHETTDAVAFVEWAKAIGSEVNAAGIDVTVAYRVIRETDEGFVRDPVGTVVVTLLRDADGVTVAALPEG